MQTDKHGMMVKAGDAFSNLKDFSRKLPLEFWV